MSPVQLGVNGHPLWSATNPATWYNAWTAPLHTAGGTLLRFDLDYTNLAGLGGVGGGWLANLVTVLTANSITPYVALAASGAQPWAIPNASTYATAAGTVAAALPAGSYIEIWNEPNEGIFWNNAPNATQYAALVAAAYTSIKAANAAVKVVGGAISYNNITFRQAMLALTPAMDAFSCHPYALNGSLVLTSPSDTSNRTHSFISAIADSIADLATYGYGSLPIFLSEYSWNCFPGGSAADIQAAAYHQQARQIALSFGPQVAGMLAYVNGDRQSSGDNQAVALLSLAQVPTQSWNAHFQPASASVTVVNGVIQGVPTVINLTGSTVVSHASAINTMQLSSGYFYKGATTNSAAISSDPAVITALKTSGILT